MTIAGDPFRGLTPDTAAAVRTLLAQAAAEGMPLRIRSGRRTCAEQAQQFALGRTAPGVIDTFAQGCQSWHVQGRAVDVDIVDGPKDYGRIGQLWKALGGAWGGDFKGRAATLRDVGHMEFHPGLTIAETCPIPSACVDTPNEAPPATPSAPSSPAPLLLGAAAVGVAGAIAYLLAGGDL